MRTDRHSRRTDLFLIRIWTDAGAEGSEEGQWRGKVQRTVDGEAHLFDSWQDLIEKLSAMILAASGAPGGVEPGEKGQTKVKGENNES